MRVLQVITSLNMGGAEKLVVEMAILMKGRGLDMTILVIGSTASVLVNRLRKNGITVVESYGVSIYNPIHIFKISSLSRRYDLIHVHLFPSLYWVGFAQIFSVKKKRMIYTEHSTSNRRRGKIIWRLLDRIIYKQFDFVVTISEDVESALIRHLGLSVNRFARVENGVDLQEIQKADPVTEKFFPMGDVDQKIILQVSSFRWPKDQKTVIMALQRLPKNVKLLLVGDGPLRSECERHVEKINLLDRVVFLGVRSDVPQLLKTADVVVLSSGHEGLSLASIEGLASGRPFVASDVPGLRDIVKGAGMLFQKGNYKGLAECILELLTNHRHYRAVTKACMERARLFDINKMVDKYLVLYRKVVS